jgi:cell division protein FtsW
LKPFFKFDLVLIFITFILLGVGVIEVYSSSYYFDVNSVHNAFLVKHLNSIYIGIGGLIIFSLFPYKFLKKIAYLAIIPLILGFIILYISPDKAINGSKRWVKIFGFSYMPSEWAKIFIIIIMAKLLYMREKFIGKFFVGILPYLIFGGIFSALVFVQPNMSDAVIIISIVMGMVFVSGMKWRHTFMISVLGIGGILLMITSSVYRMERFLSFKDPFQDPLNSGYQSIQSLYALGSGGLFGVGLGLSTQNKLYLPFSQNDFILATIAEEWGFIGIVFMLFLFLVLIYRGFRIALESNDKFGFYLAVGITIMISLHVIINFLVVASLMPVTGITLPLISSGGNSILVILVSIGILLNISSANNMCINKEER